ncbi:MAG: F(420)H(2) dehydrogenase subunit A [Methanothrix sp.]|jgi:NADH-quinone oxidoreductase subunit A|uniref:NADH-quinone oxidoreductase subunit A n=1 Tax=Candidatus Methanocrinis natronophilus TaxID=3033396 RepID=A0ABT5X4H1_9EURY|nr:NADH-quinone oxidoreductase subunit A [Candidatus Methanocrinis natronophilus]MDF0589594.1 NADH-quinone oxidoreductase subunit A [Candidatus Methanocrinis natronophilus]UEC43080.1 MAG: F(420)H(2) dehydrogenase subunit A [Methanothrix sp.]
MSGEMVAVDYYIPLIMFLIIGALVPIGALAAVKIISPQKSTFRKRSTYEGGLRPIRDAGVQYNVQYYLFAIVFVVFDVEVLFLYPWIYVYASEAIPAVGGVSIAITGMAIFIVVLLIGLLYDIKKEALRWV